MKINKSTVYTIWSAAIVLCVALSVFMLLFTSCSKPQSGSASSDQGNGDQSIDTSTPDPTNDPGAAVTDGLPDETQPSQPVESQQPQTTSARLTETPDAGQEYIDKLIFLGDSTTYGLKANGVLTEGKDTKQVWTPASGTLTLSYYSVATIVYPETGEEISIVEAVTRSQPEYLVITLGVNGISFMDEEWFINDYTSLINNVKEASPNTKIILNSIYPVAASYKYQTEINNDKIKAANGWIEKIAESTGTRFLNSFESIVGSDGNLPENYQNGDGLHLTADAFKIVLDYMRTHAYN